ncbi:SF1B family DNA helicase RecD2 [Scatolibacter rhodanostii]|uniref:SF1B family DNA helicase RecD2 n=1 Tax=Scatolibacter rhodanostii TaxID=2014781 RepID=UPI000C06E7BD|nr:ATP-dependent RecD-like DNA helicase [Scatolibacter rhodanostii]
MAEEKLFELTGSVERVVYRNDKNQYTVLEMNTGEELITVVGSLPYASEGEELHVYGTWTNHLSYGEQFKATAFEHARPATTEAMLKYLSSGAIKGIGSTTANRIIELFGNQALDVIENEPERLTQVRGITKKKALQISEEMKQVYGIRELMTYLGTYGVKPEQTIAIWKMFGDDSLNCIREDPYCMCSEELAISFNIADSIAEEMERSADNMDRVKAGVQYVLRHNLNNGHTCLPADKLCLTAQHMLGVELSQVQDAIYILCEEFQLINENFEGIDYLFLPKQHQCETYIAERMKLMLKYPAQAILDIDEEIAHIEEDNRIEYAETQRQAIRLAMEKGVLILTGGPGTGKTTTLNAIIQILKEKGETVLLAAPTGRAAKRMSELTGEEAKTIHRLLQVEWDEKDRPVFKKSERDPLECDCLVIDELSMVDSYVFESVLRALPLSCRVIFVGDSDQLPSVGEGNILKDLIDSALFATVQLKEIFRQSMQSLIVTNAHRIVEGEMPVLRARDNDFFFMPYEDKLAAADVIVSLCANRLPKSYHYSPVTDIQVLCPGRKGELGTYELNKTLREAVNPKAKEKNEIKIGGELYRLGDKVMQVRNNYQLPWAREDGTQGEGVFNGDMGIIVEIDKPAATLKVLIDDKFVTYDFEHAGSELELAYAVTVHKSQGNEFSAVIIPVLGTVSNLSYRNLLYTAITRAKNLVILVGQYETIARMVQNNKRTKRYTGLVRFLKENHSDSL